MRRGKRYERRKDCVPEQVFMGIAREMKGAAIEYILEAQKYAIVPASFKKFTKEELWKKNWTRIQEIQDSYKKYY